jgi:putative nucleotidyltransferase with HDIG domain
MASAPPLGDWEERIPPALRAVAATLHAAGHSAYLVGGSLRDLLAGREPADWDVATSARPAEVRRLFSRVLATGERHGTMTVLAGDEASDAAAGGPAAFEVTTLRADGAYSDCRRPDTVEFTDSIERDLARRDFTINALALDLATGVLIDPAGGARDIGAGIVRAVGDPAARFAEDALRLLRAARFAGQLGYAIEPATRAAMGTHAALITHVATERIAKELRLLLLGDRPSRGLMALSGSGLLTHLVPELMAGEGVTQNRFHRYDVLTHTFFTVDRAPVRPALRLAALLHDVAKPRTRALREGEATFYDHDKIGAEMADDILRRLRFPTNERVAAVHLVRHHLFLYTEEWSDAAVRRFIRRVGVEAIPDLFSLRVADSEASGRLVGAPAGLAALAARVAAMLESRDVELPPRLAITGAEVMAALGIGPGPAVGKWLAVLGEAVIDEPRLNTREQLLARLLEAARGRGDADPQSPGGPDPGDRGGPA